jgi:hypothetical protein
LLIAAFKTSSSTFDQEDVTTILDGFRGLSWVGARVVSDGILNRETENGLQPLASWRLLAPRVNEQNEGCIVLRDDAQLRKVIDHMFQCEVILTKSR